LLDPNYVVGFENAMSGRIVNPLDCRNGASAYRIISTRVACRAHAPQTRVERHHALPCPPFCHAVFLTAIS
jgi:hypothetical protein